MPSEVITRDEWLSGRLSPSRQESAVWVELFQVIEQWFDEYVFPAVERLKDARRTFGQDDEALNRLIDEFGDFFEVPEIDEEARGIQRHIDLLWRRHELHKKRTTVAFDSYVNRVMRLNGLDFQWHPLYWEAGTDYATCRFYPKIHIFFEKCNYLSSRGCIIIDLDKIAGYDNSWLADRIQRAQERARKIIPEHIVLEPAMMLRSPAMARHVSHARASWLGVIHATNAGDINTMRASGKGSNRVVHSGAKMMSISHSDNQGNQNTAHMNGKAKALTGQSIGAFQVFHAISK